MSEHNSMDNPIISCTDKQLAWNAWQIAQGHLDGKLSRTGRPVADLDGAPGEKARFDTWWEWALTANFGSLRAICLKAWIDSRESSRTSRSNPDFDTWWQTIVDAQPVTAAIE